MRESTRVLLVDKNLAEAEIMREAVLEYWPDAERLIAWDGPQAIKVLDPGEQGLLPDLIILDLRLAAVHGRDLLRHLKADRATRTIPVVIMTGT